MLLILAVLGGVLFLTTTNTSTNKEGFFLDEYHLKYPTSTSFFELQKDSVSTNDIINQITTTITPLEIEVINLGIDSLITHRPSPENKEATPVMDFSKIDTTSIERISYPKSNLNFLNELRDKLNSKSCRIIHYGDSQLEGDRITGYLRNRLQKMYGGSGPGFIPIKQAYHQISASVKHSDTWERHAIFNPTQKKFTHRKYGVFLSSSRFTPVLIDSIQIDSTLITTATIAIKKSNIAYRKFRAFKNIGLHYGNCNYPITINIYENDILIQQDSLITDGNYHNYKIKLAKTPSNLKIELKGKVSADFFGLTLDGGYGIQIDNVAMRGASGTLFTKNDATDYGRMLKELKPKVMILQFGGNTVPYLKDSIGVTKYIHRLHSQVKWLRRRQSGMSLLFIGPTDLSTSVNGKMITYELLPFLNESLKELCTNNNLAYWDMFHAMGGKNSIPIWVKEKLVGGDYIHFTPKGTKYISELFFTSLYLDLQQYTNTTTN
ncbi:MAG: lipase [Kordia sp.]|nr:MAG: lipase [Kordia sp.]